MDIGYLIRRVTGIVRPTEVFHNNLSWQQKRTLKKARKLTREDLKECNKDGD